MKELLTSLLVIALLAVAAPPVAAGSKNEVAACAAVKEEIREIESRMRAGYTRAQGEKLEAKLRKLKSRRSRLCR